MNAKSMLIAAAVLATPACAVSEADVTAASEDAVSARYGLQGETYLSRDTFTVTEYRRHDGEYVADTIHVRYRLRFLPAGPKTTKDVYGDYTYDGDGTMEYETVIDRVEVDNPMLSYRDDVSYYAKRSDGNSFRLYDCDSTSTCSDNDHVSKLDVFTLDGVKTVKLSGLNLGDQHPGVYLSGVKSREILFQPTAAAPEFATLPSATTCNANGHTLVVTPTATGESATVTLTENATGAVLTGERYSTMKDALGHYFVAASWEGVSVALGANAARYVNEVTGASFDFPVGSCTASK